MKDISDIFSPEGPLAEALPHYEVRVEQRSLAEFIANHLERGGTAVAEAGTGTGKTLAYLVPLALRAASSGERAAVSTETKNLQIQLLEKEFPLVRRILKERWGMRFSYALCLGSSNYLCLRALNELEHTGGFPLGTSPDEITAVLALRESDEIVTRYSSGLPKRLWDLIGRSSEDCAGFRCPHIDRCSYAAAREEWKKADVLLMNHHLFFSNISLGKTYLPPFEHVVFDEAHNLEQIAAEEMGFALNEKLLNSATSPRRRKGDDPYDMVPDKKLARLARTELKTVEREAAIFFAGIAPNRSRSRSERLRRPLAGGDALRDAISTAIKTHDRIRDILETENPAAGEIGAKRSLLFQILQSLGHVTGTFEDAWVYWVEEGPTLRGMPLDIGENMDNDIYSEYASVSFLSATLSVAGSFAYFRKAMGLSSPAEIILGSPFDYASSMLIYIPEDFPALDATEFPETCAREIARIAEITDGHLLALFTSYDALNAVHDHLADITERTLISQAGSDAHRAVAEFVSTPGGILLGTHSFWQGVDLPGDLLRSLVIARLPFLPPERPDVEARSDLIKERGGNPFNEYHVPQAVIKFRQGVGRLIRTAKDRGIVALFDNRIIGKYYGGSFLRSLPPGRQARRREQMLPLAEEMGIARMRDQR